MGSGLEAYRIDRDDALIFGCLDEELLADVLEARGKRLADLDEQLGIGEPGTDDYDADDRITHAQAITEIVRGTPTRDDCGAVYGWAYGDYCWSMGEVLNNGMFMPCDWDWLESLDAVLEPAGVPIRFLKLIQSLPIPIPEPEERPMIGHWTHDEIVASKEPLARLLAAGVSDPQIAEALQDVHDDWIAPAVAQPGSMIIGFYG
jgi:hypothetical protein